MTQSAAIVRQRVAEVVVKIAATNANASIEWTYANLIARLDAKERVENEMRHLRVAGYQSLNVELTPR